MDVYALQPHMVQWMDPGLPERRLDAPFNSEITAGTDVDRLLDKFKIYEKR